MGFLGQGILGSGMSIDLLGRKSFQETFPGALLHYSFSAHILFSPEGTVAHLRPASDCIELIDRKMRGMMVGP